MLDNLKLLVGIPKEDTERDDLLNFILTSATNRLKLLLGGVEPPEALKYIIMEVAVIRFNRIGSEGLSSHTVEGESLSFTEDDFAMFQSEIQAYLDQQKDNTRGKVRFL